MTLATPPVTNDPIAIAAFERLRIVLARPVAQHDSARPRRPASELGAHAAALVGGSAPLVDVAGPRLCPPGSGEVERDVECGVFSVQCSDYQPGCAANVGQHLAVGPISPEWNRCVVCAGTDRLSQ